jgi:hypothetical protein
MRANEAQDTLRDITDKIEYLTSTHYSYLNSIKGGELDPNSHEIGGYMDLHRSIIEELRAFENALEPLLFPKSEVK